MTISIDNITAVILAGGQARRMNGQDKGLIKLGNKPMIEYIIDTLKPQAAKAIINANRNHEDYAKYGLPIVADELSDYCGPLAGMASALQTITTDYMVTAPCDSPFIPNNLVKRLVQAMDTKTTDISVAHNGERIQPVFCLLKKSLVGSLNEYLQNGERKIDRWFEQHNMAIADFSDVPETFDNINTPEDIENVLAKLQCK